MRACARAGVHASWRGFWKMERSEVHGGLGEVFLAGGLGCRWAEVQRDGWVYGGERREREVVVMNLMMMVCMCCFPTIGLEV